MRSTDEAASKPSRHARAWLDRQTWRQYLHSSHDARTFAALEDWIAKGRSTVARRRDSDAGPECPLAIALPLAEDRARIAFVVDARAIVRVAPPLRLDEVIASSPRAWQAALRDLAARAERIDVSLHVYGSLAWQHITGEPCVTPQSDVDLLWTASDESQIERALDLLVAWERDSGLHADGELLLPDGSACAWRELLSRPERVLVKSDAGVAMRISPLRPVENAA